MNMISTEIPDVKVLEPKRVGDHRGFFSETYNRQALREVGIDVEFVQDNQSLSAERGVLRGFHWQIPPYAQDKLVRVVRGAILDVAVDIRRGSLTFGRHVRAVLSAENWRQIFVPVGFAHAFLTLEPNTEVIYKVSRYYSPSHERGFRWDDPDVAVDWGITANEVILSQRDQKHGRLAQVTDLF